MTVTSSSVLRPNGDVYKGSEVVLSTGTAAWQLIDDGGGVVDFTGADDATYVRVAGGHQGFTEGRVIVGLTNLLPLATDERIKQVRLRGRVIMNVPVAGFGATVTATVRDPQSGLGRTGSVYAEADPPRDEWFTSNASSVQAKTGAWRTTPPPNDGAEWTPAIVNRAQLEFVWYYSDDGGGTNTNLRLSEAYLDVDVRGRPTVSGVTVTGVDTTRPTVSWTYNPNADGDRQVRYRVKVFTAAQYSAAGFDPDVSPAAWDSGHKLSASTNHELGIDLANGASYKVYVAAAQDFNRAPWYSAWAASAAFTVSITPPPTPTLSVTSDPTVPNLRNVFQFTAALNALSADDAEFEASAGNWVNGGGFSAVARSTAQHRNGVASLALTANGSANPFAHNGGNAGVGAAATRPGQRHTLAGYLRANTTGRAFRLVLRWLDASKNYLSQTNGSTATDTSSGWTALPAVTGTAPTGAVWVLAQVEAVATPANGEIHYLDQLQIVPGDTAPAWSPGGLLGTASAVIEYAQVTGNSPNLASRQLYGGGDDQLSTAGWYTTGTTSQVAFDMLDRYRGIGSIRWDVEDAASVLAVGLPPGAVVSDDQPYALPAVPDRTYGFSLWARAGTAFTTQLSVQPVDKAGTAVGAPSPAGTVVLGDTWTRLTVWATIPAGAAYVRPQLANSVGVTGRKVWVDAVQWELGDPDLGPATLARPAGTSPVWQPVRGFLPGKAVIPAVNQALVAFDHEAPPGVTVTYRGWIYATFAATGEILTSAATGYTQTMLDPPGQGNWVLSEVAPAPFLRGQVHVLPGIAESQHEEVTAYYPIRPPEPAGVGQRPVHLSDYIGGHDGTIQIAGLSDDNWWLLEQLLALRDSLWFTESQGGGKYIRVKDRNWSRTRFRDKCINLADGTVLESEEWERVLTVAYDHASRPPDNLAPVIFAVDPVKAVAGETTTVLLGDSGRGTDNVQTTQAGAPKLFDQGIGVGTLRVTAAVAAGDSGTAADNLTVDQGTTPPPSDLVFPGAPTNWIDTSGGCSNAASTTVTDGVQHDFGTP